MYKVLLSAFLISIGASCIETNSPPEGLRLAEESGGPRIKWDLDARPFPDIPFPNDVATIVDSTTTTGRSLNVSFEGGSDQEEKVRKYVNRMAGFGTFSPISVGFESPIDLNNLVRRHQQKVPEFSDDAVFLVNIDPKSQNYGKFELIDFGLGNFPILLEEPDRYYDNDPRVGGTNLLYESTQEVDSNGNGILDPIEDTDDDGVWDAPNLLDPSKDPLLPGNTLEWYERETNTLILRPVHTLEPATRYAVVLSSALVGEDGRSVDSPFDWINHTRQSSELSALRKILPDKLPQRFDKTLKDVRFAWVFSTQNPMEDLLSVRAGLYGHGTLKRLHDEFPAEFHAIHNMNSPESETPTFFKLDPLIELLAPLLPSLFGVASGSADVIKANLSAIDYLVSGTFISPYFLADKDGLANADYAGDFNPQDDDEVIEINPKTGEAYYQPGEVTFMCTVPKQTGNLKPPFPTIIYSHAINSTRLEILLFGGALSKFGFATCAIDAVGHGVVIPPEFSNLIGGATERLDIPNFPGAIEHHRAVDLNNDGIAESGGMFFTADILHTRDNFRQTAIDQLQFMRILRQFDGESRWPDNFADSEWTRARPGLFTGFDADLDGTPEIRGDFNGDGVVDFGGDIAYVAFGTSLGGIQSTLLAGIEPTIRASVSNAGGGGLTDVSYRTTIRNARDGVVLRMIGPLLHGVALEPAEDGTARTRLYLTLATADRSANVEIGVVEGIEEGDQIVLRNPNREVRRAVPEHEKKSYTWVRNGRFRISIASDADEATRRKAKLGFDARLAFNELIGCAEERRCDQTCPGNHTCNAENICIPIRQCIETFDAENPQFVDDEETEEDEATIFAEEFAKRTITDAREYGDPWFVEVYSPEGELKFVIDEFPANTVFENILYPKGSPLAALTTGLGLKRQTPNFRKFIGIAQTLIEGADPAVVAPHFQIRPFEFPYESEHFRDGYTNFVMAGTVGDQTVPISNGITIARTAGAIETLREDPRYEGLTENQFLIDNFVYEGIARFNRFADKPNTLFDADDLDEGLFRNPNTPDESYPNVDAEIPTRATWQTATGFSGLRLPYLKVTGEHTFNAPLTDTGFDATTFMTNWVGWYLIHRGQAYSDDPCLEQNEMVECEFIDLETFEPPDLFDCTTGACSTPFSP